jgi:hypothetical protein
MPILVIQTNKPFTIFRCKKCGAIEHHVPARKWHWIIGGERCCGEWEEGTAELIFTPRSENKEAKPT